MDPVIALELPRVPEIASPEPVEAQTPRRPRLWTTFATWFTAAIAGQFAVLAGFIVAGIAIGIVMGSQGADAATIQARVTELLQQPLLALLLSLIPCQLGMVAVVLLAARWSKEPLKQRVGLVPQTGRTFGPFRLATMAAFTLSTVWATAIGTTLLLGQPTASPIGTVLTDGSWAAITLLAVLLSVIPALVEELLFRGYIQRRLLERWSPSVAIGVSTLLFALLHADSLQHIISVIPLGIITGVLAYRTNSVKPGMLVHAVHNAGVVAFGAFARVMSSQMSDESLGIILIGAIVVLGLIGLPAIISLLRRERSPGASSTFVNPTTESLASQIA